MKEKGKESKGAKGREGATDRCYTKFGPRGVYTVYNFRFPMRGQANS